MLFRMPREGFLQLVLGHLRQDDVLDDHRMTVDAGSYLGRLDFVFVENISNGSRDRIQFHYLAINDRIRLQAFISQAKQLKVSAFTPEFDGLDGTRADIDANHALVATFPNHLWFLAILNICMRCRLTRARARRARGKLPRTNLHRRGLIFIVESFALNYWRLVICVGRGNLSGGLAGSFRTPL